MSDLVSAIEAFGQLTIQRHRGQIGAEDRTRLGELESFIRENIDGARTGQKKAASVLSTGEIATQKRPAAPEQPVGPALSTKDAGKLKSVATIPKSGYTPPASFQFADYFGSVVGPPVRLAGSTVGARTVDGQPIELSDEVKVLFGVTERAAPPESAGEPIQLDASALQPIPLDAGALSPVDEAPVAVAPPVQTPPTSIPLATMPRPAAPKVAQAVVHLNEGGHKRGELSSIDLESGIVTLSVGGKPDPIQLSTVLTIFVAPIPGAPVRPASGQGLVVTLVNGREVTGKSPDYAPGVQAMTLIPEQRGKVDYVWVPAWSVQALRFA